MKALKLIKPFCKLCAASAVVGSSLTMTNCGGGVSASGSNFTIRPKTLEGLELTLDGPTLKLTFARSATSDSANKSGDSEFGSVLYNYDGDTQVHTSVASTPIDAVWPHNVGEISYEYVAINDSAGELRLNVNSADYIIENDAMHGVNRVGPNVNSDINVFYFSGDLTMSTTRFLMTFTNDGSNLQKVAIRVEPDDETTVRVVNDDNDADFTGLLTLDQLSFLTEGTLKIAASGGPVPTNYNVFDNGNDLVVSSIPNASLSGRTVFFTPDAADPFSLACAANASGAFDVDEIGQCIYREDGGTIITNSADYEYDRLPGLDAAELKLSQTLTIDGTYVMTYTSPESETQRAAGTYVVRAPGQPYDGQTGRFIIRSGTDPID
ncbi:hypothetical protein Rhal01_01987 [Rubritalea halochordaticola]|uniref:DUF4397 domain-containing protein n=1 Tax=Rubritalea halochordaticola TaxID=714537 RepID=A0ABP9UZZ9_9BACT